MSKLEVISFNKQIFHAVSLSGGKDSTAMLLLMIERGLPINTVLWADTGMEFPEMYDHIRKVDDYLYRERGIHITMLRHPKGFEYLMFEEEKQKPSSIENRQRLGVPLYGNGWPGVKVRWCTGQLKTHLISKEVNRIKGEYQALHYVGIAADEPKRIKNEQYPLVDWGITEAEALKLCYDGAAVYDAETHQCLRVYGDYPDEKAQEQAAAFALEHDTAQQNAAELPAFLDMHLIEANLLDDGGHKHKRQEIFEYFQAHKNLAERTEFLKNSYNDIWVEVLTDGVRTGYHAEKDGLLMWEGSYLSRTSESVFSWSVITEMTEGLIERGEYKIKLGLQNAPIVAEQLALFDMGGDAPVYEAPADAPSGILAPARTVPQEVIDLALCTGGNEPNSAERIAVFYMRERPEPENISFLRREFGRANGRGIEYEGRKYAVWFLEDGIHLAQGDSVRTGYSKTVVTWGLAAGRILGLLRAGIYLSASELAQAPDKVLHEAMDALLMTARDLNEDGRAQGLFPQTLAIHDQHKGYPELDEDMVAFAKTDGGLQMLAQEYHAFLYAYHDDPSILR